MSALVTAHDAEEHIAATLDSVLAQEYPAESLEAIVVDDGSIDRTAELAEEYEARYPGRVRVIRQPPAGPVAATARALAEARGEVLGLLAAGDAWPAGRIALQVAVLEQHPELGLVYSEVAHPGEEPPDPPVGRPVARLLREDCIAPSSIALRATLRDQLGPIPPTILRADRWLTARAATLAEIAWAPAPSAPAPAGGEAQIVPDRAAGLRETLVLQRWFLQNATTEPPLAEELGAIWSAFTATARQLLATGGGEPFVDLVLVTDADRDGTAHLIAVLGPIDTAVRERLPAKADALLTRLPRTPRATPHFDAGSIGGLRELSRRAPAPAA